MTDKNTLATLINKFWKDKYVCKLSILDHLRECLEKDNYLKATDTPKTDVGYSNLDKELMDLLILLQMYFYQNDDLYTTRLQKFLANLSLKH